MTDDHTAKLRLTLERIDERLLDLLSKDARVDKRRLKSLAQLENARGAVQRLLIAAEAKNAA